MRSKVKRQYSSALRQNQARATRAAVVSAARQCFIRHGYAATTLDEIAEAAGVSRATVFNAVGGKAALLKAAYDVAIVGDDAPVALVRRARSQEILGLPDPGRMLAAYAEVAAEINSRVAELHVVLRGAAAADPEARKLWEVLQEQRRVGADNLTRPIVERGRLKPGIDAREAADLIWILNDPGIYHTLVMERGWSSNSYQVWLAGALQSQLLPAGQRPPT